MNKSPMFNVLTFNPKKSTLPLLSTGMGELTNQILEEMNKSIFSLTNRNKIGENVCVCVCVCVHVYECVCALLWVNIQCLLPLTNYIEPY